MSPLSSVAVERSTLPGLLRFARDEGLKSDTRALPVMFLLSIHERLCLMYTVQFHYTEFSLLFGLTPCFQTEWEPQIVLQAGHVRGILIVYFTLK